MITLLQFNNRMYSLFLRQGVMAIGVLALLLVAVWAQDAMSRRRKSNLLLLH